MKKLTQKQENFCIAYIETGIASEAYRRAYNTERMKDKQVWEEACKLLKRPNVTQRVKELREEAKDRAMVTLERVIEELAVIAFVDPIDIFDDAGNVLPLSHMKESARRAIGGIKRRTVTGQSIEETVEAKLLNKLDALEKLMRHLGGYEQDNRQKQDQIIIVGEPKEFDA
jgi:phage terminase small subunit